MSHCVTEVPVSVSELQPQRSLVHLNMRTGSDGWVVLKRDEISPETRKSM